MSIKKYDLFTLNVSKDLYMKYVKKFGFKIKNKFKKDYAANVKELKYELKIFYNL